MPTPPGAVHQAALELLADGEWQPYRKVVNELIKRVPPGVAMRRIERQRLRRAVADGHAEPEFRKVRRPSDVLIAAGAASIAREVLTNKRRFEIEPRGTVRDQDKRVRLKRVGDGD